MVRCFALFALICGASGLKAEQVASFEDALEQLNHNLAIFENRDLKDSKVYDEYVSVRNEAKKAAAALAEARNSLPPPDPTDWGHDDADDITEEDSLEVEEKEKSSEDDPIDEKTQQAQLVDMDVEEMPVERVQALALKVKEQHELVIENEDKKEQKRQEKLQAKLEAKKDKEMKLKLKKQMTLKTKEGRDAQQRDLLQFQSPYRAAMKKKDLKEPDVIDEGHGTYGKFKDLIMGSDLGASSFMEAGEESSAPPQRNLVQQPKKTAQPSGKTGLQPKKSTQQPGKTGQDKAKLKQEEPRKILSLEATMAQREKELQEEALIRKKATVEANKALKLCNGARKCEKMVEQKLEHGVFDHMVKDKLNGYRF